LQANLVFLDAGVGACADILVNVKMKELEQPKRDIKRGRSQNNVEMNEQSERKKANVVMEN